MYTFLYLLYIYIYLYITAEKKNISTILNTLHYTHSLTLNRFRKRKTTSAVPMQCMAGGWIILVDYEVYVPWVMNHDGSLCVYRGEQMMKYLSELGVLVMQFKIRRTVDCWKRKLFVLFRLSNSLLAIRQSRAHESAHTHTGAHALQLQQHLKKLRLRSPPEIKRCLAPRDHDPFLP